MRSPHQRRARPPWTSTLGPKPSSDVCGLVVVLVFRVQPRLKKKQSCAGECADCSTRGGVTDLAAAGFCVFADAAAAAAKAMAAAADLAIGRDCRTMMSSSSLSAGRQRERRTVDPLRQIGASRQARRACGKTQQRRRSPRRARHRSAKALRREHRTGGGGSHGRLSVRWCCRQRGEHGAWRARDNRCSFCAMGSEALRREVDHEALRRGERGVCDAQHRDTTRAAFGTGKAFRPRSSKPFDTPGPTGLTRRLCSPWEWRPAGAACRPRVAPPGSAPRSPARRRRHPSSPAPRR
jgi:hypothetical protein